MRKTPLSTGPLFDVCEKRHRGNPESRAAFDAIGDRLTEGQEKVLNLIRTSKDRGLTCDEIARLTNKGQNAVSGRITELLRDGKIKRDGRRITISGCYASVLKAI